MSISISRPWNFKVSHLSGINVVASGMNLGIVQVEHCGIESVIAGNDLASIICAHDIGRRAILAWSSSIKIRERSRGQRTLVTQTNVVADDKVRASRVDLGVVYRLQLIRRNIIRSADAVADVPGLDGVIPNTSTCWHREQSRQNDEGRSERCNHCRRKECRFC